MFYWALMLTLLSADFFLAWYGDRWLRQSDRGPAWRAALAAFLLVQILWMLRILFWPFVQRHELNLVLVLGFCLTYAWHLLVIPPTLLTIGLIEAKKRLRPSTRLIETPTVSRRTFLRGAGVAIPPLLAIGGMGFSASELYRFRTRALTVRLRSLPAGLDGMTIAQVSDTHIGRFTNDRMLDAIVAECDRLNPDLLLFAGDLIDIAQADLLTAVRFANRLQGRFGEFFCEGNHDLIEDGANKTHVFESTVRKAGLPYLLDESASLRVHGIPVQLIGARWDRSERERQDRTARLMRLRDPDAFSIFLTHHPHGWDYATTPLTLCGHTHGGQLMLNERLGIGSIYFRYWSGPYERGDQTLVVSNGTGNWFPIRTHAPAEIIMLTLRSLA